jgi:hypothetical protein
MEPFEHNDIQTLTRWGLNLNKIFSELDLRNIDIPRLGKNPDHKSIANYCFRVCEFFEKTDFYKVTGIGPKWISARKEIFDTGIEYLRKTVPNNKDLIRDFVKSKPLKEFWTLEYKYYFSNLALIACGGEPYKYTRERKLILAQWKKYINNIKDEKKYGRELFNNEDWEKIKNKTYKPEKN